jgi:hypothetical protein
MNALWTNRREAEVELAACDLAGVHQPRSPLPPEKNPAGQWQNLGPDTFTSTQATLPTLGYSAEPDLRGRCQPVTLPWGGPAWEGWEQGRPCWGPSFPWGSWGQLTANLHEVGAWGRGLRDISGPQESRAMSAVWGQRACCLG